MSKNRRDHFNKSAYFLEQNVLSEVSSTRRETPSFHSQNGQYEEQNSKHVSFLDEYKTEPTQSTNHSNEKKQKNKAKLSDLCSEDKKKVENILKQLTTEVEEKRKLHEEYQIMQQAYEEKLDKIRRSSKEAYCEQRNLSKDFRESIKMLEESQNTVMTFQNCIRKLTLNSQLIQLKNKSLRLSQYKPSLKSSKNNTIQDPLKESEGFNFSARIVTEESTHREGGRSELKLSDINSNGKENEKTSQKKKSRNSSASFMEGSQFGESKLTGKKKLIEDLKSEIKFLGESIKSINKIGKGRKRDSEENNTNSIEQNTENQSQKIEKAHGQDNSRQSYEFTETKRKGILSSNSSMNQNDQSIERRQTSKGQFELGEINNILFQKDKLPDSKFNNSESRVMQDTKNEILRKRKLLDKMQEKQLSATGEFDLIELGSELKLSNLQINKSFQTTSRNAISSRSNSKTKTNYSQECEKDLSLIKSEQQMNFYKQSENKNQEQKHHQKKNIYDNQIPSEQSSKYSDQQSQYKNSSNNNILNNKYQQYLQIKQRIIDNIDNNSTPTDDSESQSEDDQTIRKQLLNRFKGVQEDSISSSNDLKSYPEEKNNKNFEQLQNNYQQNYSKHGPLPNFLQSQKDGQTNYENLHIQDKYQQQKLDLQGQQTNKYQQLYEYPTFDNKGQDQRSYLNNPTNSISHSIQGGFLQQQQQQQNYLKFNISNNNQINSFKSINQNGAFETFCQNESMSQPKIDDEIPQDQIVDYYLKEQRKQAFNKNEICEISDSINNKSKADCTVRDLQHLLQFQSNTNINKSHNQQINSSLNSNQNNTSNTNSYYHAIHQEKKEDKKENQFLDSNTQVCKPIQFKTQYHSQKEEGDDDLFEIVQLLNSSNQNTFQTNHNSKQYFQNKPHQNPSKQNIYSKPKSLERQAKHNQAVQNLFIEENQKGECDKIKTKQLLQRYSSLVGEISEKLKVKKQL